MVDEYKLLKSADYGETFDSVLDGQRISAICINPEDTQMILAGTTTSSGTSRIYKSTDGGSSWKYVDVGNSITYINEIAMLSDDVFFASCNKLLLKSTDKGDTWTLLQPTGRPCRALSIDMENKIIYISTNNNYFLKSVDGAETWTILDNVAFSYCSAIDKNNPSTIYTGNASTNAIRKTTDWGATWSTIYDDYYCYAMKIDPSDSNIIYAGVNSIAVIKTTDGGQTWAQKNEGIPTFVIDKLAIEPNDTNIIYAGISGAIPSGFYKTTDSAENWTTKITKEIYSIGVAGEGVVYVGGLFPAKKINRQMSFFQFQRNVLRVR